MPGPVKALRDGPVLRLILDNPPANALSLEAIACLKSELDAAREDEGLRVVVLSAEGKLFSGGHDLKEMTAHRGDPDRGKGFFDHVFAACSALMQAIVDLPQPVIAEVDGTATAAGCQLVASCDLAYASDCASFGVNGIDVGMFCSTPAVALTRNVPIKRAMEMLLTGQLIDAATALEIGLLTRAVPHGLLRETVDEAAGAIAAKSSPAIRLGKRLTYRQAGMGLAEAYGCASRVIVENMLLADAEEGIEAFLEKREPNWQQK